MSNAPCLDVDFIHNNFNESILGYYQGALDFISDAPDYSLVNFRKIIESLCDELLEYKKIYIKKNPLLEEKINILNEQRVLFQGVNSLHEVRKLCNFGAHPPLETEQKEKYEKYKESAKEKAIKVSKLILDIFGDTYLGLDKGKSVPKLIPSEIGKQSYKELLFKVTTQDCNEIELLQAGSTYETLARRHSIPSPGLKRDNYILRQRFVFNLAANCYKTSYKINADMHEEVHILKYCQLEPLFKYASLASKGLLGEEQVKEGWKLMKIAADRGHTEALVPYGKYCHERQLDLSEAELYFTKAVEHDEPLSYGALAHFYKMNGIHANKIQPLLEKGVKLSDSNSMYQLGLMYQKGDTVEQDKEKSETLLRNAAENGSMEAFFILPEIKEAIETVSNKLKGLEHDIKERMTLRPIKREEKIGRNDPCWCGSEKKYKKCCLRK